MQEIEIKPNFVIVIIIACSIGPFFGTGIPELDFMGPGILVLAPGLKPI
jgi:hypothetical protein